MKTKRLILLLAGLAVFLAAPAAAEQKEVLLGISTDFEKGELAIEVVSTGCTKKEDFRFEFKDNVLTVIRKERDACKAMPEKIRLTYKLREIGIDPNKPFRVSNELIVNENLANLSKSLPAGGPPTVAEACRKDLAQRLNIGLEQVDVKSSASVVWPDSALGLPRPGEVVAQMKAPGHSLILGVKPGDREYLYTSSDKAFRYGGPLELWAASALTIEGEEDDPNLNGDLMQLSLNGTNPEVILEGISDFYPQENGSLLVKRRTSRSGHELFYVAPGKTRDAVRIAAAFDFVDAAVSPDGLKGAAIARLDPTLSWELMVAPLPAAAAEFRHIDLPDGLKPERLYWGPESRYNSVEKMNILVVSGSQGGQPVWYKFAGLEGAPRWDPLRGFVDPVNRDFLLNKSQSLFVSESAVAGRPAVRVEMYEFQLRGTRDIATIPGLKLDDCQWACGRQFVFVTGRENDTHTALTVDIDSGEVLTAASGMHHPVKLFKVPPYAWLRIAKITRQAL